MKSLVLALLMIGSIAFADAESTLEREAAAIRLDSEVEVLPVEGEPDGLRAAPEEKFTRCFCEQRIQTDIHRRYCADDQKSADGCVKDSLPVDFRIEYYEAKVVRDGSLISTGNGFDSVYACHDFLSRYPGCAKL